VEDYEKAMSKIKDRNRLIMLIEREGVLYYATFGT